MCDRIDPPIHPDEQGPWPRVTDLSRLYDHGWPWCANAAGHPDLRDGYPDPERHLPWHECRGLEVFVDGAPRDLDGEPLLLSVYLAAPFRFGAARAEGVETAPRIVLDASPDDSNDTASRVSLTPGEALRLARALTRLADDLTFVSRDI